MRLYRSTFTFLAFLALGISCNKKDEEVKPVENCRFVGKSVSREQKAAAETSVETDESNFKQDDQGRLTLVTFSRTESRKNSTGVYASSTDEETYEFVYDTEGFLTELKRHDLRLQQGSANFEFSYATLRYRTGKMETTSVTTFVYNEGRLQSSEYVSSLVVQGDNLPAATFPESYTTLYKYDSQGKIQTATSGGSVVSYTNGIRTSQVLADSKIVIKYDGQGRMINYSSPFDQRTFKYDQRGNQIFQDSYDNDEFVFSTETKFDEHTNPDNMIPSRYKGIAEPVKIPYVNDNPNNMIESIFNHRNDVPVVTSNVWTYHPNGLPAISTMKTGTDFYQTTQITKFKYENCD
jgi:YD repeat-containing protein